MLRTQECPLATIRKTEGADTANTTDGRKRSALLATLVALSGLAVLTLAPSHAQAAWPERTIKIIVPFTAGGATDIVGRIVADELSRQLATPAIVENREGAAGVIGVQAATRAAPDGYTLLVTANSAVTSHKTLYKKLPYDPLRDLDPVSRISAGSHIIVVKASSPFKDVKDLLKAAAAKPGAISYGSGGNGSSVHLAAELLQVQSGFKLLHVPYRGTSLAVTGLLAGDTDVMFDTTPSSYPRIKSGQLRALGVTSLARAPELPDVPTVAEQGLPHYEVLLWLGLYAPKGTPPEILARIDAAMKTLLATDRVSKRLDLLGMKPYYANGADLGKQVARETAEWADVIHKAGVTLD